MRKIYYLFSLLLGFLFVFNTACIVNASPAGLQVTFTTNPVIVAPGTNGYIEVNLKSIGSAMGGIDISATSWDSTVVVPQGNWEVYVGSLDSGDSYSLIYEFKVPSTATPGLYQVVFEVQYYGGYGYDIRQTAVVKVEDQTILDVSSVSPTSINIGEATTLLFNITNNGGSSIDNILFTWEDTNNLILPIGSDNRIMISSIAAKNYTELPVTVMASSGISPGVYPLKITMDFYDQTGTEQTVVSTVGLQVSGTTDFELVLQQSTSGSTTFAVANTGANTASSVIVSIPTQLSYMASGVSSVSLGNLNAGDYTLASFQLSSTTLDNTTQQSSFNRSGMNFPPSGGNFSRDTFMNRSFSGQTGNQLIVEISYTDTFGVRRTVQKEVTMSSSFGSSSSFTSRTGTRSSSDQSSGSGNVTLYIAIGVIGIIIIAAIIRLGRKKKLPQISKFFKGRKE